MVKEEYNKKYDTITKKLIVSYTGMLKSREYSLYSLQAQKLLEYADYLVRLGKATTTSTLFYVAYHVRTKSQYEQFLGVVEDNQ